MFKIGNLKIGKNLPPVIIAEIGINHNGSIDRAIEIADAAIRSGAKIIKHQTHILEDEMSLEAKKIVPGNSKKSIFEIIKNSLLNERDEKKLMNYIKSKKRIFISTPFSRKAADRLNNFNVPAFKIGSGECNNYPLIKYICKFKKPIILSTGMNNISSIRPAVNIIKKAKIPLAILHCTNIYPTPPKLVRLDCISVLKKYFPSCVIGISDHTETIYSSLGAVSLGARIIEKHFVDSKQRKGPDISSSMDPKELRDLILGSEIIFKSRGANKEALKQENKTIAFAFASVVSTKKIYKGQKLSKDNIFVKRPGTGDFKIKDLEKLYGKIAVQDIPFNIQIKKKFIK